MHATCSLCPAPLRGEKSAWLSIRGTLRTLPTPRPIRPRRDGRLGVTVLATLTAPTTPRLIGDRRRRLTASDVAARETAGSACSRARRRCRPVGSDVDNLDRPNARDPSATARRERAYKFGQAQRARGVQLFGHPSSTVLRDAEAPPCTLSTDKPMDGVATSFSKPESSEFATLALPTAESCGWRIVYL